MTNWDPALYDSKHKFVSDYGENLISFLNPQKGEYILDIGCGTGDSAYDISRNGAIVTGIDASQPMIEAAREKYPHLCFEMEEAENLSYSGQFHAIFSNAAMHWMKDLRKVAGKCYEALLPGGRFVAELGGANNIRAIVGAIKEASRRLHIPYEEALFPWVFPDKKEMTKHLENAGFQVTVMDHYERPTPLIGEDGLRNWLEMFSGNLFKHLTGEEKETIYDECERILHPVLYHDHQWTADYWRIRFIAEKR